MNITKRDVLELRRRLTKKECTFSRLCGCYVNSEKKVVLQFEEDFFDLQQDECYKYLEIAKKTLSGTLGNSLLALEFDRTDMGRERQQYLLALKSSRLKQTELLKPLYEQMIAHYACTGNYLILVFHDCYDVITRASDRQQLDESSEAYEYLICAICPVELSQPGLGYHEDENRIGVRIRDWMVGLPHVGFVYPAFCERSSDVNTIMYYVKNGKVSHPEVMEQVLGCQSCRTAAEQRALFENIVRDAFEGEDTEQADAAFFQIQKSLYEISLEQELDDLPPVQITQDMVLDMISDVNMPAPVRQQITREYGQEFERELPCAHNLVDNRLVEQGAQRARTVELEQQIAMLTEQLTEQEEQTYQADIALYTDEQKAQGVAVKVIDGQRFLVIPLADGETVSINGDYLTI